MVGGREIYVILWEGGCLFIVRERLVLRISCSEYDDSLPKYVSQGLMYMCLLSQNIGTALFC